MKKVSGCVNWVSGAGELSRAAAAGDNVGGQTALSTCIGGTVVVVEHAINID